MSEVRGGNVRSYLASKVKASDERSYIASKVKGCGRVVLPRV